MQARQFGPYRLLHRLGKGGMAEVFLAEAPSNSGFSKLIAIKTLLGSYNSDEQLVSMLADEARVSVWLYHPNIVQVFDFGEIEGTHYIAMEFVDGCDLTTLIRDRRNRKGRALPLATAIFATLQITEALDYAHRRSADDGSPLNIIHRDVSPHNVLISREGGVKLADFGLARASISAHHSLTGVIRGKYAYMPKEQAQGDTIDQRIDIFAAGVTLYEALTGVRPYTSSNLAQQLYQLEHPIAPPSTHMPDIPEEIDDLTLQAMSPTLNERYGSAAEMAEDLSHALAKLSTPQQEAHQLAALVVSRLPVSLSQKLNIQTSTSNLDIAPYEGSLIHEDAKAARRSFSSAKDKNENIHKHQTQEVFDRDIIEQQAESITNDIIIPPKNVSVRSESNQPRFEDDDLSELDTLVSDPPQISTSSYREHDSSRENASTHSHHVTTDSEQEDLAKTIKRSPEEALKAFQRALEKKQAGEQAFEQVTKAVRRPDEKSNHALALILAAFALIGIGLAGGWLLRDKVRGQDIPSPSDSTLKNASKPDSSITTQALTTNSSDRGLPDKGSKDSTIDLPQDLAKKIDQAPSDLDNLDPLPDLNDLAPAALPPKIESSKPKKTTKRLRKSRKKRRKIRVYDEPVSDNDDVDEEDDDNDSNIASNPKTTKSDAKAFGKLQVDSQIPALIYINGKQAGITPLRLEIPVGIYRVKALKKGVRSFSPTVFLKIVANQITTHRF